MSLIARLQSALAAPPGPLAGDWDFRDGAERPGDFTPAAVLIAIIARAAPTVLLTRRTDHLRRHAGQVAFPGGRVDPGEDAIRAALREAEEEIGLPPAAVTVIGPVDQYRTVTGYAVTPVLAAIPADLRFTLSPGEVASVFEAPLDHLLDPANQIEQDAMWRGVPRRYWEIHWEDRRIWGATAAMIVNLSRRLAWP